MNVSVHSASSSNSHINEAGRDGSGSGYHSPSERPIELGIFKIKLFLLVFSLQFSLFCAAFLDNLRPPGSPRFNRAAGSSDTAGQVAQDYSGVVDIEAERARDRASHEKFLKIHVRHVTDGQGVVAGVLLVTPNTVMFDPNVSDALVMEHGAEAYGVIAPVEFVVNAALYPDIAHMRVDTEHSGGKPDQPISDPIYFPTDCPLHRKYAALKERLQRSKDGGGVAETEQAEAEEDPAAGILAIAGIF